MQRVFERTERLGIHAAGVVTFPSAGARDLFAADVPGSLDGKDVRVIYNGVDMRQFSSPIPLRRENDVFIIAVVCALVEEKRFDRVIDIAEGLREQGVQLRLVHAGDGRLKDELQRSVKEKRLDEVIEFRGRLEREDVLAMLRQSHCFLLPGERVVFDLASLEAMASGVPPVLSDDGGNREMITDGADGFLCPPADVASYIRCIEELYREEELRRELGAAARETVRSRFTLEHIVAEFAAVYEHVLRIGEKKSQ
jgi:1,4-alpha-glucan branching enzyme